MIRTQRIEIDLALTDWANIPKGIPQGFIQGFLLFNNLSMIGSFSQQNVSSVILLMTIAIILVVWV